MKRRKVEEERKKIEGEDGRDEGKVEWQKLKIKKGKTVWFQNKETNFFSDSDFLPKMKIDTKVFVVESQTWKLILESKIQLNNVNWKRRKKNYILNFVLPKNVIHLLHLDGAAEEWPQSPFFCQQLIAASSPSGCPEKLHPPIAFSPIWLSAPRCSHR